MFYEEKQESYLINIASLSLKNNESVEYQYSNFQ